MSLVRTIGIINLNASHYFKNNKAMQFLHFLIVKIFMLQSKDLLIKVSIAKESKKYKQINFTTP